MSPFDTYISENYSKLILITRRIITTSDYEDICNEMILELLTKPRELQAYLLANNEVLKYFAGMIARSRNKNSSYQTKYNRVQLVLDDNIESLEDSHVEDTQPPSFKVLDIIDKLTRQEKMLIKLRFEQDMSYSKISKLMSTTQPIIKEKICKIMKKVKKSYEDDRGTDM